MCTKLVSTFGTVSGVNDGIESLAQHYGIHLISELDFSQILSRVEEFVSVVL